MRKINKEIYPIIYNFEQVCRRFAAICCAFVAYSLHVRHIFVTYSLKMRDNFAGFLNNLCKIAASLSRICSDFAVFEI